MLAHVKHHLRAAQELAGGTHWLCSHDNHGSLQACNQMRKALPKASTILKMPSAYTCVSQSTLSSSSPSMSQLTGNVHQHRGNATLVVGAPGISTQCLIHQPYCTPLWRCTLQAGSCCAQAVPLKRKGGSLWEDRRPHRGRGEGSSCRTCPDRHVPVGRG
jgi:hypothetical protein